MKPKNGTVSKDKPDTMMNLLDSTDSDVEWLNLPPIKGKKPKKRKPMKAVPNSDNSSCTLWGFLKGFLVFAVIVAICLLSIVITWMSGEISDLRERLKSVESRSESSVQDLNTFMVKLSDVNKTVHNIQTGKNSLNEVIKNISSINNEISELSHKVNKLSAGLDAAPELRQIPDKLQTVSKTVAELGSEVTGMKDKVDSFSQFMKTSNTKLDELSNKVTEIDSSAKNTDETNLSPELANLIQNVPVQLKNLNASLLTQMSLLQSTLTEHEQRFVLLENSTATLIKNLPAMSHSTMPAVPGSDTSDLKVQVEGILHEMMNKNSSNLVPGVSIDRKTMNQLLGNIDNLTTTVQDLKDNYRKLLEANGSPDSIDTGDNDQLVQLLKSYEEGFNNKLTVMNTSMTHLKRDFNHYVGIIGKHSNQLVDIEHQIKEIHRFILTAPVNQSIESPQGTKLPGEENPPPTQPRATQPPATRPPATQPPAHVGGKTTEAPVKESVTSERAPGEGGPRASTVAPMKKESGTTMVPPGGTTPPTAETTTRNPDIIAVPSIHNITELELNFRRWDINGNGKVIYDILLNYLGRSTPDIEKLKKFDANQDGLYSFPEFVAAFGYSMDDLPPDSPFRDQEGQGGQDES